MTDKERLDALELFVKGRPLLLWNGIGGYPAGKKFCEFSGLSLMGGSRSLRKALDDCLPGIPVKRTKKQEPA